MVQIPLIAVDIHLSHPNTAKDVATRPGWKTISAVVNKHVVVVPLDIADRWGPRLVDLYRFIASSTRNIK